MKDWAVLRFLSHGREPRLQILGSSSRLLRLRGFGHGDDVLG
jgi:hypothetical protein